LTAWTAWISTGKCFVLLFRFALGLLTLSFLLFRLLLMFFLFFRTLSSWAWTSAFGLEDLGDCLDYERYVRFFFFLLWNDTNIPFASLLLGNTSLNLGFRIGLGKLRFFFCLGTKLTFLFLFSLGTTPGISLGI